MNIRVNDSLIKNVDIVDSGDVLGLRFVSAMSFAELEALFTPATSPEFRIVNLIETDVTEEIVVGVYKNRKLLSVKVTANDNDNTVELVLQVTPAKIEEVEILTNQVNDQSEAIAEQQSVLDTQAIVISEQANTIAAQSEQIAEQEAEIDDLQARLADTQHNLTVAQEGLAEAQATNEMLTACVLEMSELVYA